MNRGAIYALVALSGLAALSWETLWQIRAGLALGVSAWGTGLTLAVTMGGMGLGALAMGRRLRGTVASPLRLYGLLEAIIGGCGLALPAAFTLAEHIDTRVYAASPAAAPLVYILCLAAIIGLPALCMGATLPVLGLISRQTGASLPWLYGLNTAGAAAGTLGSAFVLIPALGLAGTGWATAGINGTVALGAWLLAPHLKTSPAPAAGKPSARTQVSISNARLLAAATGFATLALEVAWFRSLTAAFTSTTTSFAIMLAVVLAALGLAAALVAPLRARKLHPGALAAAAGALVLAATPLIERFDMIHALFYGNALAVALNRLALTFYVAGPPVILLGLALPWLLDERDSAAAWARLYAINTLAAIAGALAGAWLLLPLIGAARTAWLAGVLVSAAGIAAAPRQLRARLGAAAIFALTLAVAFDSGAGHLRVQGHLIDSPQDPPVRILEAIEGPEATVSALEYRSGSRALVIDGFVAASQLKTGGRAADHYMAWMGRLPMLLHPAPKTALVICFGTGQTANAVRNEFSANAAHRENPAALDVIDVNPNVFRLAHNFPANENVLEDPRAHTIEMDGRAWLRRAEKTYDVITLEPMPPNFAGVNALYSREFYALVAQRLAPGGIVAQWVPFHLVGLPQVAAIAKTFHAAFPDSLLWLDPASRTGILLGSRDGKNLSANWPGLERHPLKREYSDAEIREAVFLDAPGIEIFSARGNLVTDDDQFLAYGDAVRPVTKEMKQETFDALNGARAAAEAEKPPSRRRAFPGWTVWP
jgi:spermidine synthase